MLLFQFLIKNLSEILLDLQKSCKDIREILYILHQVSPNVSILYNHGIICQNLETNMGTLLLTNCRLYLDLTIFFTVLFQDPVQDTVFHHVAYGQFLECIVLYVCVYVCTHIY